MEKKIRVLAAKPGLDGHDRGVKVVISGLMDAGMEVIYTGLRQTPAQIVEAAIQEDVDVIGLSSLSGAHMFNFIEIADKLTARGFDDILLIGGGIIPEDEIPILKSKGIRAIFGPGTAIKDCVDFINNNVRRS